jgi:hypothetical protein
MVAAVAAERGQMQAAQQAQADLAVVETVDDERLEVPVLQILAVAVEEPVVKIPVVLVARV